MLGEHKSVYQKKRFTIRAIRLFLIFVISFSVQTFAAPNASGPIIVGGGAGEGEFSVIFVRSNLKQIIEECAAISCHLDSADQQLLKNISKNSEHPPEIFFTDSTILNEKIFEIRGQHVLINQEKLWTDVEKTKAYSVADAGALWIQILATWNDVPTSTQVIREALTLSLITETRRSKLELDPQKTVEFILWKNKTQDILVVRDPALESIDLSDSISHALKCSSPSEIRLYSPSWMPTNWNFPVFANDHHLTLQFGISWRCGKQSFSSNGYSSMQLILKNNSPWSFDPASIDSYVELLN